MRHADFNIARKQTRNHLIDMADLREYLTTTAPDKLIQDALFELQRGPSEDSVPALYALVYRCCVRRYLLVAPLTQPVVAGVAEMQRIHATQSSEAMLALMERDAYDLCCWVLSDARLADYLCANREEVVVAACRMHDSRYLKLFLESSHFVIGNDVVFSHRSVVRTLAIANKLEYFKMCISTLPWRFCARTAMYALLSWNDLPDDGVGFYQAIRSRFPLVKMLPYHREPQGNHVLVAIFDQERELSTDASRTCLPLSLRSKLDAIQQDLAQYVGPDCANLVFMSTLDVLDPLLLQRVRQLVWAK